MRNIKIKKINENKIVATSTFPHKFSMNEGFLNFSKPIMLIASSL
jgi:hypothetical protein